MGELIGVVESPNSESEEHADDPEWDAGADETLDTEANRRGLRGNTASREDVLRERPLVRREVAGTGGGIDGFGVGLAGVVKGSCTICTCGNIFELGTNSSRENEIGTVTRLQISQ